MLALTIARLQLQELLRRGSSGAAAADGRVIALTTWGFSASRLSTTT